MKATFDRSRLLTIALPAILFIAGISATCSARAQTQDWKKEAARDLVKVAGGKMTMLDYKVCKLLNQRGLTPKFDIFSART